MRCPAINCISIGDIILLLGDTAVTFNRSRDNSVSEGGSIDIHDIL